jgi:hypothetical protein
VPGEEGSGNAIIWRTGRFDLVRAKTWQTTRASRGGTCRISTQVRTINEVIRFRDMAGAKETPSATCVTQPASV